MAPTAFVAFNGILMAAAWRDIRTMRIPNALALLMAILAVIADCPVSLAEAGSRLATALLVSAAGLMLYLLRCLGGGDLKLLAAAALWMPLGSAGQFAVLLGLAGGLQGVGVLSMARFRPPHRAVPHCGRQMPYAVSIMAAGLGWSLSQIIWS